MPVYAVINSNKVENIIVADTLEIAESVTLQKCVDITDISDVKIGTKYNGTEFEIEITDFPDSDPNAILFKE